MRGLRLSTKLLVPDLTTETIGIIGKRGSGKSHTGTLLVEELLELGSQVIVLDPTGGWWGLRAGADGQKDGGYPIPIFGGQHGDMPLEERGGALLAEYVIENRLSAVLDLSDFSKSAMRRFVRDFAEKFYLLKNKRRDPVHIVIDECDLFVPQRVDSADMLPLVGAINDFVLRGRQRGIGVTLISQRPARINKDVLTQVEILIAFRLTGPQDIKAFGEWIEHNGTKEAQKEVLGSLSSLERGTGWFWAPGMDGDGMHDDNAGMLRKVEFRERCTFDSSRTPDGKKVKPPKTLADVDLGELSDAMKETVERARLEDPKALKGEVMRLKKELEKRTLRGVEEAPRKIQAAPAPPRLPKRVEVPMLTKRQEAKLDKQVSALVDALANANEEALRATGAANSALDELKRLRQQMHHLAIGKITVPRPSGEIVAGGGVVRAGPSISNGVAQTATSRHPSRPDSPKKAAPQGSEESNGELTGMHRKMLIALAQHPNGLTKAQLLLHTGYSSSGPTSKAFAFLMSHVFAESDGTKLYITMDGTAALGEYEELPTGDALYLYLMESDKLSGMEKKILRVAHDRFPEVCAKGEILTQAEYASSGPTSKAFGRLVRYGYLVAQGSSRLSASEVLFDL